MEGTGRADNSPRALGAATVSLERSESMILALVSYRRAISPVNTPAYRLSNFEFHSRALLRLFVQRDYDSPE